MVRSFMDGLMTIEIVPRPVQCILREIIDWNVDTPVNPGDMFWVTFTSGHCSTHEPPCERHLHVVCPDRSWWDIDGQANNCTNPTNKRHHCWIRHGEPPAISVDKDGVTCSAGAGSIQTKTWHGYLRNGQLVD